MPTHLIGLLLGTEEDWSAAYETLMARVAPRISHGGATHDFALERVTIEPFDLRMKPRHKLVIDRLAHWYYVPREWVKKVALMDDVYLMNNPFTFQAMEKHSAYCAMMRLDLTEIAGHIGYPLFMKPFDGGAWVGVSRIKDGRELQRRYDESGQRLMHLQKAVDGFDVFVRSLSIGAETMVMHFQPDRPLHDRYMVDHEFLDAELGAEAITLGRTINAFFRWEFNSCETLVKGGEQYPIDYANACPDVSLISLHYYFPWAIRTLLKWCVYCCVTDRPMRVELEPKPWFEIGDSDRSYEEKLAEYRRLADEYFEVDAYEEFMAEHLPELDEILVGYVESPEFDRLLVETVTRAFPPHEHEKFVGHYRGLLAAWASDQHAAA